MKVLALFLSMFLLISAFAFSQGESEESEVLSIEQLKEELNKIKGQLQGVIKIETELKTDREELKQLIISNNETVALKMLLSIAAACESFRADQKMNNFPRKFEELKGYISDKVINAASSSDPMLGYYYDYQYVLGDHFKLKAVPAVKGETGERTFILDDSGSIIEEETGEKVSLE
ncbi:MAG: hypothetical protein U9Q08_04610 [Candidatus Omnitrophota bacterium]|nr:hypothetical protein [Candidatus Omnitrophota bacterium]